MGASVSQDRAVDREPLTDSEVVKRVLEGDTALFELLVRRHNQTLFRAIRAYVSSEDEVIDLMQESYMKAYVHLDQFRLDSLFSTWLIRIGINEALQWIRANKRVVVLEEQKMNDVIATHPIREAAETPESVIINRELGAMLTTAIDSIPDKYRIVFILAEIEQMSQADIAHCLQISVGNVKVRLHRAKHLIKDQLLGLVRHESVLEFGNQKCDRVVRGVMSSIMLCEYGPAAASGRFDPCTQRT